MRVDKLVLPDFRNLKNFEIDFDEESARTVLVGRNGVGKTNILEALTRIFRQLDLRTKPEFAYKITYKCNGYLIEAESSILTDPKSEASADRFVMHYSVTPTNRSDGTAAPVPISENAFYKLNSQTCASGSPRGSGKFCDLV